MKTTNLVWKWVKLLGSSTGIRGETKELRTTALYFEKFKLEIER